MHKEKYLHPIWKWKIEAVSHFQSFLQSQDSTTEDISVSSLHNLLIYKCSRDAAALIDGPVTSLEIHKALLFLSRVTRYGQMDSQKIFL